MSRPLMARNHSQNSLIDSYSDESHFPPRTTSAHPTRSPPSTRYMPNRKEEARIGISTADADYESLAGSREAEFSPISPFRMRHQSLTPSMSASNLGHHLGSDEDHGGAKNWEHMKAGHEKLQSSKEKYDFVPSEFAHLGPEIDDELHDPGKPVKRKGPDRLVSDSRKTRQGASLSCLGILNILAIIFIACALIGVFAGLPITEHFLERNVETTGSFGLFGTNATGQVPQLPRDLVDVDTPDAVKSRTGQDGDEYVLVFSDEFNDDGRTFWPGDDPYWEAVDLHYHVTNDLERYIPDQVTTKDGYLQITLDNAPNPAANGNLDYISSMISSWNKFCFTGGIIEVNVSLPGDGTTPGFWPAAWTMGNLGRAGFAATTDGMWPYSYESCDVGTLPNQTNYNDPTTPVAAASSGRRSSDLSFLPGQKLSACTCPNSDHPGPQQSDGTYLGRAAPELDLIEAQTNEGLGTVASQSYQLAPFNAAYQLMNGTGGREYWSDNGFDTIENAYKGGVFQQAASGLSTVPAAAFETQGGFITYAVEYAPSNTGDGYIYFMQGGVKTWKLTDVDLQPDPATEIAARPVTNEPMYIILNFGISNSFGEVDFNHLPIPSTYRIDYVRVWQKSGAINYGCDGQTGKYPTTDYIQSHLEAYSDANLTTWQQYGQAFPKNRLEGGC